MLFFIEFGAPIFYTLIDVYVSNTVHQGPSVFFMARICIVLSNWGLYFIRVFFLMLILPISLMVTSVHAQPGAVKNENPAGNSVTQIMPGSLEALSPIFKFSPMLAQAAIPVLDEEPLDEGDKALVSGKPAEPITRKLPIWGEKAREQGYDLPLPFGVGTNLLFMAQDIEIRNVKVGIGDPLFEIEGLSFEDAQSHDRANTARLDLWLLPFANIYGIFGYINGEAEFDLDISKIFSNLPIPGLPPVIGPSGSIDLNIDYNGTTFGGGMTLAGGYKNFFASVDGNYTYSNIDVVDGKIRVYTISPRVGMLVNPESVPGSLAFWVGAMYMRYRQTVSDDINLQEVDDRLPSVEIDFELDVKNDKPWNFLFGSQWEITKRWNITAEGGIGDRKQVLTGLSFRF
jgi:hypothetical protein